MSLSGEALEHVTIEAMLPHSVAAIIEFQTENKAGLLQRLRRTLRIVGGTLTPTSYLFEKQGRIMYEKKDGATADGCMDQAIEAGATDITSDEEGRIVVFTDPTETKSVSEALSKSAGLTIEQLEIIWAPNQDTLIDLKDEEQIHAIEEALAAIREEASIRDIYLNTTQPF